MMFPDFRLSELEQDVAFKRRAFDASREELTAQIKDKFRPLTLLKDNKKVILSTLFTIVSAKQLFGRTAGFIQESASKRAKTPKKRGLAGKAAVAAGFLGARLLGVMAKGTGSFIIKRAMRSFFR
jgi:hypothetical protein